MRPAAGVECVECRERKGHRCQAQIFIDVDDAEARPWPVCLPCADGEPCSVDRVGAPPAAGVDAPMFEAEIPPAPVIHRTPEELGIERVTACAERAAADALHGEDGSLDAVTLNASMKQARSEAAKLIRDVEARAKRRNRLPRPRVVSARIRVRADDDGELEVKVIGGEQVRMSPHAVMGPEMIECGAQSAELRAQESEERSSEMPKQIADEVKAQVVKDYETMSNTENAKKNGVAVSTVGRIFQAWSGGGAVKAKPEKKTALMKPGQRAVAIDASPAASAVVDAATDLTLTLRIPLTEARRRLEQLSPEQVVIALRAVMEASLHA